MIRKCFGGKEKELRAKKKVILRKMVVSAFFRHYGSEVCVGRCMCSRNHGGKKVI